MHSLNITTLVSLVRFNAYIDCVYVTESYTLQVSYIQLSSSRSYHISFIIGLDVLIIIWYILYNSMASYVFLWRQTYGADPIEYATLQQLYARMTFKCWWRWDMTLTGDCDVEASMKDMYTYVLRNNLKVFTDSFQNSELKTQNWFI